MYPTKDSFRTKNNKKKADKAIEDGERDLKRYFMAKILKTKDTKF